LGLAQPVAVLAAVAELEAVHGLELRPEFLARLRVQELVEARTGPDAHVVRALGTHLEIPGQLRAVQHRVARGTLGPDPLRHRAARDAVGLDAGGKELLEPAHELGATVWFLGKAVMAGECPIVHGERGRAACPAALLTPGTFDPSV